MTKDEPGLPAQHDIAVIGAGAAGCMAAITAARALRSVVLIERNNSIGRKLLITGKGRCNMTNTAPIDEFIKRFGRQGEFLRTAFHAFFNEDLIGFFRSSGLETKVERQGRVFPKSDSARSVVDALKSSLDAAGVDMVYGTRVLSIEGSDGSFRIRTDRGSHIAAGKVILSSGGASYAATGSSGDGYKIASSLGHRIVKLTAGLVPLTTGEYWVKALQGLGLENISLTFQCGRKRLRSEVGEAIFTHFGLSGPLVLDMSREVLAMIDENAMKSSGCVAKAFIDLKPGLSAEQLDVRLLKDFKSKGKARLKNVMKGYLPQRLIDIFLKISGIDAAREVNQITQPERRVLVELFKALPLTITGSLKLEEAMVTGGGVSTKDINPRTMESRVVPGLYLAGELIDGCASSGGYNLQQAFSTGYLAGECAAKSIAGA